MTYKRFPNTGTLLYANAPTINTLGYRTQGTLTTIHVHCDIQPSGGRYAVGRDGDKVLYNYLVICPKITTAFNDTVGLRFGFNGASYTVVDIHNYQKHTEIVI